MSEIVEDEIETKWAVDPVLKYKQKVQIVDLPKKVRHIRFILGKFSYDGSDIDVRAVPKTQGEFEIYNEVFLREEYRFLLGPKKVLDIGANTGDTAIYFALHGQEVIALEPYPYLYNVALRNVKNNRSLLKNGITLINEGYGRDSDKTVMSEKVKNGYRSLNEEFTSGDKISISSLGWLIKKYGLKNSYLKMDCEGCEYGLLDEPLSVLRKFKKMQIEYHFGFEPLATMLKNLGFDVSVTVPRCERNPAIEGEMQCGYIYASREGF